MKMRTIFLMIAAFAMLGMGSAALAELGVSDSGERGTAVINVAEVALKCTSGGTAESRCSMPNNGAGWSVSENAAKVQFNINYRFVNERPVLSQRFTVGYKVYKQEGSDWTLIAEKTAAVDKTVGANSNASGTVAIPVQKMDKEGGTFKIAIRYDTCDVKTDFATRVLTVDRVL